MQGSVTGHGLWSLNGCDRQERKTFLKMFLPLLSLLTMLFAR